MRISDTRSQMSSTVPGTLEALGRGMIFRLIIQKRHYLRRFEALNGREDEESFCKFVLFADCTSS